MKKIVIALAVLALASCSSITIDSCNMPNNGCSNIHLEGGGQVLITKERVFVWFSPLFLSSRTS